MTKMKELRRKAALTQKDLAELMGVTQSAVSAWETGINDPCLKKLLKLAEILGCRPEDFIGSETTDTKKD